MKDISIAVLILGLLAWWSFELWEEEKMHIDILSGTQRAEKRFLKHCKVINKQVVCIRRNNDKD